MPEITRRPLNRQRVLGAALELIDADGLDALSMRRLGAALGVEAMSLYNHVSSKDDLLGGVADLLLEMVTVPEASSDWRRDLVELCSAVREMGLAHPQAFPLLASQTRASIASWRPILAGFESIGRGGLDGDRAVVAADALASFLVGFVLFEVTAAGARSVAVGAFLDGAEGDEGLRRYLVARTGIGPDKGFTRALNVVLDGIEAAIGR